MAAHGVMEERASTFRKYQPPQSSHTDLLEHMQPTCPFTAYFCGLVKHPTGVSSLIKPYYIQ